jgi:hypothetical protein
MSKTWIPGALALLALAAPLSGQNLRETTVARVSSALAIAADPEILKAVREQNGRHEPLEAILVKDQEWVASRAYPLRRTLTSNPCAERLRELTLDDPKIAEAIVMDAMGANVCSSRETSDYWQGDEPKFQRTFGAGKPLFIDQPSYDASSGAYAIQLSTLVMDGGAKLGVVTLTLRVPRAD